LQEEGHLVLHISMIEVGVGPFEPKKDIFQNGSIENAKPKT
jgi:hypothetical protein